MTEAELLAAVRQLAKLTGWLAYHTHDSRRSEPGFPDVVLASPKHRRIIYAELKTATGRTTCEQDMWLEALDTVGCEVALWRPADLPTIAETLRGKRIQSGQYRAAWTKRRDDMTTANDPRAGTPYARARKENP